MEKVLLTGGIGFVASHICRELIKQGYQPVIVDAFIRYISPLKEKTTVNFQERFDGIIDKVIIERGFAHHFDTMYDIILRHQPAYIIHLAGLPLAKLPNLNVNEAKEGSIDATMNILSIVNKIHQQDKSYKLKRFVYTSSSMVYGNFSKDVVDETESTDPIEIYGTMKLGGEIVTKGLCRCFGINYAIVRPSAVYGALDNNYRVTQIFIENAFFGKDINVNGKDERLDFTYVEDLASGFVLAMITPDAINQTFNITGGDGRTLLEFAEIVKTYFPATKINVTERDAYRPKRGTLDISKARRLLAYSPQYHIEDGIDVCINYLKKKMGEKEKTEKTDEVEKV